MNEGIKNLRGLLILSLDDRRSVLLMNLRDTLLAKWATNVSLSSRSPRREERAGERRAFSPKIYERW
jgi:hypothetical protein